MCTALRHSFGKYVVCIGSVHQQAMVVHDTLSQALLLRGRCCCLLIAGGVACGDGCTQWGNPVSTAALSGSGCCPTCLRLPVRVGEADVTSTAHACTHPGITHFGPPAAAWVAVALQLPLAAAASGLGPQAGAAHAGGCGSWHRHVRPSAAAATYSLLAGSWCTMCLLSNADV